MCVCVTVHMFALGDASSHATPKLGHWAGEQGKFLAHELVAVLSVMGGMMTRMVKGKEII